MCVCDLHSYISINNQLTNVFCTMESYGLTDYEFGSWWQWTALPMGQNNELTMSEPFHKSILILI